VFVAGVKSLKTKILGNITLNVVLCSRGTDNVNLKTGCQEDGREWGTVRSGDLCALCSLPNFVKVFSSGRLGCTEQNFENLVPKIGKSPIISKCNK